MSEGIEQIDGKVVALPQAAAAQAEQPLAAAPAQDSSGAKTMTMQRVDPDGRPIGEPKQVKIPSSNVGRIPVNRKFSADVARTIRARKAAGEKICKLAREFGCCRHTIQRLCRGACYREVEA